MRYLGVMSVQARAFHTTSRILERQIVSPFKTPFSHHNVQVDRNIPINRKPKAWERDNANKEEWFRKKYSHVHARTKASGEAKDSRESRASSKVEGRKLSKEGSNVTRHNKPRRYFDDPRNKKAIDKVNRHLSNEKDEQREIDGEYKQSRYERNHLAGLNPAPLYDNLFGTSAIIAALRSGKRSVFSELYFQSGKGDGSKIIRMAQKLGIPCTRAEKIDLNRLSNNNVHNGFVLRTKPLLPEEITGLAPVNLETAIYGVMKNPFGKEFVEELQIADTVNGDKKYPLGVYLDEITDPHNVGAILRSAYYLGADFIIMSERNCSKLTPVVSKSSSGAMEFIPIYSVNSPMKFVDASRSNGWKFISAVPHTSERNPKRVHVDDLKDLVTKGPCILMFGSEGTGIRTNLMTRSDHFVALSSNRKDLDDSIDSLNVSVAAALLIQKFLA